MAQSCVNISNNVALDLEKKIESICKEASSYYSSLFKKMSCKVALFYHLDYLVAYITQNMLPLNISFNLL